MMSFRTINQKRARFKMFASKIERYMQNNINFYTGCLLWAYYLVNSNLDSPKDIEGNFAQNLTEEQIKEYDYMLHVNFLENYFDSFERDMLYYAGKKYIIPKRWKNVLSLYGEFLELNKGFTNLKKTSDLILPEKLAQINFDCDILTLVNNAVKENNLELFSSISEFD